MSITEYDQTSEYDICPGCDLLDQACICERCEDCDRKLEACRCEGDYCDD